MLHFLLCNEPQSNREDERLANSACQTAASDPPPRRLQRPATCVLNARQMVQNAAPPPVLPVSDSLAGARASPRPRRSQRPVCRPGCWKGLASALRSWTSLSPPLKKLFEAPALLRAAGTYLPPASSSHFLSLFFPHLWM